MKINKASGVLFTIVLLLFLMTFACSQKPHFKTFKEIGISPSVLNGSWYGDSSGQFYQHMIFITVNADEISISAKEYFMQERVYFKGKATQNPVKGTYYHSSPVGGGMSFEMEGDCELRVYSKDSVELFFGNERREFYTRWFAKTWKDEEKNEGESIR